MVTDPQSGDSSGYRLVASSAGFGESEAAELAAHPLITDYLHLEDKPGHYFAYYRLGKTWVMTHRFSHGTRRGSFNRVVVHALRLDPELLFAIAQDPWLLLSHVTYVDAKGSDQRLTDIGEQLATRFSAQGSPQPLAATVTALEPLRAVVPEKAADARWSVVGSRLERPTSDVDQLFARVLDAVASNRRILWPQGPRAAQSLLACWAPLPLADRQRLGFTTHLNPNASELFALANVADPERLIVGLPAGEAWELHDNLPEPSAAAAELGSLLERFPERFRRLVEHADSRRLSLSRDLAGLGWWAYVERQGGANALIEGFDGLDALRDFLVRVPKELATARRLPATTLPAKNVAVIDIESRAFVTAVLAASLLRLLDQETPQAALSTIQGLAASCDLTPEATVAIEAQGLTENHGTKLSAVGLALRPGDSKAVGDADVSALAAAWSAVDRRRLGSGEQALYDHIGQELAFELNTRGSGSTGMVITALMASDDGAEALYRRLLSQPAGGARRRMAARAFTVARHDLARRLVQDELAPALIEGHREAQLHAELPAIALQATALPGVFLKLLACDVEVVAAAARQALDGADPPRVQDIAGAWARESARDSEVGSALSASPLLVGVASRFADADVPASVWLPISYSEARVLDASGTEPVRSEDPVFKKLFARPIAGDLVHAMAPGLFTWCRRSLELRAFGRHHQRLLATFARDNAGSLATCELIDLISGLERLERASVSDWGRLVRFIALTLQKAGARQTASGAVAAWMLAVLITRADSWSVDLLDMLVCLERGDAQRVARRLIDVVPNLPQGEPWQSLLKRAMALIGPDEQQQLRFRQALIGRTVVVDGRDVREAFDQALHLAFPDGLSHDALADPRIARQVAEVARETLPPEDGRIAALLRLLADGGRSFAIREPLERRLLLGELEYGGGQLARELPSFTAFASEASPAMLMTVARQLARVWKSHPSHVVSFLRSAAETRRFDVVGVFLRHAESQGADFLAQLDDRQLIRLLRQAVERPQHWTDLGPLQPRIRRLREARR